MLLFNSIVSHVLQGHIPQTRTQPAYLVYQGHILVHLVLSVLSVHWALTRDYRGVPAVLHAMLVSSLRYREPLHVLHAPIQQAP
jgi:hypothetical protein